MWPPDLCVCGLLVTQSCSTLCDPTSCSPPGFSVHGILQARILEWVAIFFSIVLLPQRQILYSLSYREVSGGLLNIFLYPIYIYICIYIYMCLCVYMCICVYMSVCMYMCVYVYMCVCMYMYICLYMCVCMCMCVCMYM